MYAWFKTKTKAETSIRIIVLNMKRWFWTIKTYLELILNILMKNKIKLQHIEHVSFYARLNLKGMLL